MKRIPVTVFTGFLGAGKTTIIRDLIKQFPSDYKLALLKNEFGDIKVDSLLLETKNVKVTEMLNGCLCCILVGKLGDALKELVKYQTPNRIIIETSGSAYPAPIALEIDKLKELFKLDGIITVIDMLNFDSYKDTSFTAKLQAQYTDLILLNKHELVSTEKYEAVLDSINELNTSTPKVKTNQGEINKNLIFGIFETDINDLDNIEINVHHHDLEVDILQIQTQKVFSKKSLQDLFKHLPSWDFYRIKGMSGNNIYNYVLGRLTTEEIKRKDKNTKIVFMGKNLLYHAKKIKMFLQLSDKEISIQDQQHHLN